MRRVIQLLFPPEALLPLKVVTFIYAPHPTPSGVLFGLAPPGTAVPSVLHLSSAGYLGLCYQSPSRQLTQAASAASLSFQVQTCHFYSVAWPLSQQLPLPGFHGGWNFLSFREPTVTLPLVASTNTLRVWIYLDLSNEPTSTVFTEQDRLNHREEILSLHLKQVIRS